MQKTMGLSAAILFAIAALATGPARAATISGTYFEDSASTGCSGNALTCTLLFPVLPSATSGLLLTLSEVSCIVRSNEKIESMSIFVTDNGANGRRFHYISIENRTGTQSFREALEFKITGGPPRQIAISQTSDVLPSFASLQCTVVGKLSQQ